MTDDDPCVRVVDAAPIERFLRANNIAVVRMAGPDERWLVNGRVVLDATGLLTMANMKRRRAGLAPFVWGQRAGDHAQAQTIAPAETPTIEDQVPRRRRPVRGLPTPPTASATNELLRVKILAADLALELAEVRARGND